MSVDADPATEAERFRRVSARFTDRVRGVPDGGWERPAPCEGWVARDVVAHLAEWIPGYLSGIGIELGAVPSVDDDPVAAWASLAEGVQRVLDDPAQAERVLETPQFGTVTVAAMIDRIVTGDLLVHTWDLARATGQDETIDEAMAAEMLAGMEPMDEMMRSSGQFGPRVPVPDDADVTTRLVAFTGRTP